MNATECNALLHSKPLWTRYTRVLDCPSNNITAKNPFVLSEALVNVDLWCWKPIEEHKSMLDPRIVSTAMLGAKRENQPSQCGHNSKQPENTAQASNVLLTSNISSAVCIHLLKCTCMGFCRDLFAWFISVLEKNSTVILLRKTILINDDNNSLKMKSAVKPLTRQYNRCDWASEGNQSKFICSQVL